MYAYAPYAREMDVWAALFPRLAIAAPVRDEAPPGDTMPIAASDLRLAPQPETGGTSFGAKLVQLALLPASIWRLASAMRRADAVHVRCPGNIGLLGALLAPVFARHRIAKYAGQWDSYPGEAWTVRLQRRVLRSRWWRAPVLAYTSGEVQSRHVVPFFSTAFTRADIVEATDAVARRRPSSILRVLYVGRLSDSKNVEHLLEAVALLRGEGLRLRCTIVGGGDRREALEILARRRGIEDTVDFVGAVPPSTVRSHYADADVLVLPSNTEGWPKVIAEAMVFGLVCVGPGRGVVPSMLGEGRGVLLTANTPTEIAAAIGDVAAHPERYLEMRRRAASWAREFTLEHFGDALRDVLHQWWTPRAEPSTTHRIDARAH